MEISNKYISTEAFIYIYIYIYICIYIVVCGCGNLLPSGTTFTLLMLLLSGWAYSTD